MAHYKTPKEMFEHRIGVSQKLLSKAENKLEKVKKSKDFEKIKVAEEEVIRYQNALLDNKRKAEEYKNSEWDQRDENNCLIK